MAMSEGIEGRQPSVVHNLGARLRARFEELKRERRLAEEGWLRDLRQYFGIDGYTEDGSDAAREPGRSRAFGRITRAKIKGVDGRMLDMLFPGGSDKNWTIEPTPEPELPQPVLREVMRKLCSAKLAALAEEANRISGKDPAAAAEAIRRGLMPSPEQLADAEQQLLAGAVPALVAPTQAELDAAIKEEAAARAKRMEAQIDDYLTEGRFVDAVRDVLHSGHLFGTGWLKGPLIETRRVSSWLLNPDTGQWELTTRVAHRPYFEFVPIWDVYPDSIEATSVDQLEGIFQRYVMTKAQVRALIRRPLFNADAITRYLRHHPDGDCPQWLPWENDLRMIRREDQGQLSTSRSRRYEVIEYTGYVSGHELVQCGCTDIAEELVDQEFKANVWLLGDQVIKAVLVPFDDESVDLYHIYRFEKSDTSIYGESIPSVMRDPQGIFNAALRAMLDNAGDSAGPVWDVNIDLLDAGEIAALSKGMYPNKVLMRHGEGQAAQYPAVRAISIESHVDRYLKMLEFARRLADETTAIPSYTYGEQASGVAETVGGLSMLMGQANIVLKDAVRNYDDGIAKPFIRALYNWEMQFGEREDVKGDFQVKATAAASLIAKEIRARSLDEFAMTTKDPVDGPYIKRGELTRERARVRDLDPDRFVRSDEEVAEMMRQQAAAAAAQQTQAGQGGSA